MSVLVANHCVIPESNHTPPTEGHWKFLGGREVLKAKLLEEKYEAKLEFPGGGKGTNTKKLSVRGVCMSMHCKLLILRLTYHSA